MHKIKYLALPFSDLFPYAHICVMTIQRYRIFSEVSLVPLPSQYTSAQRGKYYSDFCRHILQGSQ